MAPQPTAPAPQPPPELPSMPDVSATLTNYLRTFALWCSNGFANKMSITSALRGVMLRAFDAASSNPPVFMLEVTSNGALALAPMALGSGDIGTPVPIGEGDYLPLAGGTLTGGLNVNGTVSSFSGVFESVAAVNANAHFILADWNETIRSYHYWEHTNDTIITTHAGAGANYSLASDGNFYTSNMIVSVGYRCRTGLNGAFGGNYFNFFWDQANLQGWIDNYNPGYVTWNSDYRIKKDIEPLPSTWEQVKALRPISYTQKEYTPPAVNGKALDAPLFSNDDVERWGFVAHELQETLIDSAATGWKDSPQHIQSPNHWTVIAALTRTVQEMQGRIEALEAAR
jgi:hypothetical protein